MQEEQALISLLINPETREKGFQQLVNQYAQRLYWHVRRMVIDHDDTDDLLQEIFIKIWQNLDKFRGDSKLYTWLYRIATNETLTFLQKKKKATLTSLEDNQALVDTWEAGLASGSVSGEEIELKLQRAMLTLTDKQRQIFQMKYFEYLTFEQIAEITGTTVGGLKATYHTAMKKIEEKLMEE
ncbi:MAG: RNA polymerase sigma factor [Spirosomataceae bacterium]